MTQQYHSNVYIQEKQSYMSVHSSIIQIAKKYKWLSQQTK